jgi:Domain of unknown function (DUF4282)
VEKGFFGSLFDVSFSSLITTKVIKVIYVLSMIVIGLVALLFVAAAFSESAAAGLFTLVVLAPVAAFFYLIYTRVLLEVIICLFRIMETNTELVALQRAATGPATPPSPPEPPSTPPPPTRSAHPEAQHGLRLPGDPQAQRVAPRRQPPAGGGAPERQRSRPATGRSARARRAARSAARAGCRTWPPRARARGPRSAGTHPHPASPSAWRSGSPPGPRPRSSRPSPGARCT